MRVAVHHLEAITAHGIDAVQSCFAADAVKDGLRPMETVAFR